MIYLPGQLPGVIASAEVITGARSQLSVAVAVPVLAGRLDAVILMVTGAGQVMTGGEISRTVIVWVQLAVLPQLSEAVQVRKMM